MKLEDTGLRKQPFASSGTPSVVVPYASHQAAIRFLNETRFHPNGLGLLHGPRLSGKTSTIRRFTDMLPADYAVAVVDGAGITAAALLQEILVQFGYDHGFDSASERFGMVRVFALQQAASGTAPLLIVENAHAANPVTLELLCELAELAVDGYSALRMILVSDRSMLPIIKAPAMQSMSCRLTGRFLLQPMSRRETRDFICRKLASGGCRTPAHVMPPNVCDRLHVVSGGWPGIVDRLALQALSGARRCPLGVNDVPAPSTSGQNRTRKVTRGPELILTCRRKTLARIDLDRPRLIIGRDQMAELRVEDDFVSRQHALILRKGNSTLIVDLNSRNGTYVNRERVKRQVLVNNDIISLGDHRIKFADPSARRRTKIEDAGWDDTTIAKSLRHVRTAIAKQLRRKSAS
jgi:type II secretory pathway predicted ATPase ExeA